MPSARLPKITALVVVLTLAHGLVGCADVAPAPALIAIPTNVQNNFYLTTVTTASTMPAAGPIPQRSPPLSSGFATCDAFYLETLRCGYVVAGTGAGLEPLERSLLEARDEQRDIARYGSESAKDEVASSCEAALRAYDRAPCAPRL